MFKLFNSSSRTHASKPAQKRRATRLRMESLEDRVVMADGALDTTFGTLYDKFNGNTQTITHGGYSAVATTTKVALLSGWGPTVYPGSVKGLVVQPSGKSIMAEQDNNVNAAKLIRFNSDGSLDTSFGTNGIATITFGALAAGSLGGTDVLTKMLIQPDGRIILAGTDAAATLSGNKNQFIVTRLTVDGVLDTTFGSGGRSNFDVGYQASLNDAILQSDGKIVAVGGSINLSTDNTDQDFVAVRLNTDGKADSTFGDLAAPGSNVHTGMARIKMAANYKADYATNVVEMPDTHSLLVFGMTDGISNGWGGTTYGPSFTRLNTDGSLDVSYATAGKKLYTWDFGFIKSVILAVQPLSGLTVLAGNTGSNQIQFARFLNDGKVDTTFSSNGLVQLPAIQGSLTDMTVMNDDSFIISGSISQKKSWNPNSDNDFRVMRLNSKAQLDTTFNSTGSSIIPWDCQIPQNNVDENDYGQRIAVQPSDGKILIAGMIPGKTYYEFGLNRIQATLPPKISTSTSLAASSTSIQVTDLITFTATVSPSSARGTVEFDDGNIKLGSVSLVNGSASFSYSGFGIGTHGVIAKFLETPIYAASNSSTLNIEVAAKPASIGLTLSSGETAWGGNVKLTATIFPVLATGQVQFYDGSTPLGSAVTVQNGAASLDVNSLAVGTHSITAQYSGDNTYKAMTSTATVLIIDQATSTLALTLSKTTAEYGQKIDLTANVSPTTGTGQATGTVVFRDDATELGRVDLTNGRAVLSLTSLALGSHPITVEYLGTPNLTGGLSAVQTLVIQQASTSLALVATPATVGYRAPLKLTATAASAGGSVAGSIRFMDGSTELGSVTLTNGKAELLIDQKTSPLASGNHSIQAIYDASGVFAGSSSTAVVVKVLSAISPTIALTASPNQSLIGQGQKVTFSVKLTSTSGTPTGLVDLLDNGAPLQAGVPVVNGTATFTTSNLPIGTHSIQANYLGDTLFGPVTSTTAVNFEIIQPVSTMTTLAVDPASLAFAMPVTLTATIAAATPPTGGTVDFYDGSKKLGQASLSANGTASLPLAGLGVGSHALKAVYSGFERFIASQSVVSTVSVDKATSSTTLSLAATQVVWGSGTPRVDLTAQVDGPGHSTSGTVSFFRGTLLLGSAALANGAAILTTNQLQLGDNSITARYDGDPNYLASESSPGTVKVLGQTTVSLQASPIPVIVGKPLTLTANVLSAQGNPEGTVEFWEGGTSLGQATLVGGIAKLAISSLAIGQHSFVAKYNPAANSPFAANNSPAASASVTDIPGSAIASLNIVRSGTRIIRIELVANGPLDKLTAETLANYTMVYAGRDGKFATKDDVKINLAKSKLSYNPATNVITLTPPGGKLALTGTARLTIANLKDNLGRPFDGDRNGLPGGVCNVNINRTGTYSFA